MHAFLSILWNPVDGWGLGRFFPALFCAVRLVSFEAIGMRACDNAPMNGYPALHQALMEPDPVEKCRQVQALWQAFQRGQLVFTPEDPPIPVPDPGRPARPELVHPRDLPKRSLRTVQGQAAMLHAIAHIEFNAINLALDAAWRFREVPGDFVRDWLEVAADEARHFGLLQQRLQALGHAYGDFPAHNGLWEMAVKTDHALLARMGMVPRVLEARGLDVTPGIRKRFAAIGDAASCEVLDVILREEVAHVAKGNRWFAWACEQAGKPVEQTFQELLEVYYPRGLSGPFNCEARLHAGFGEGELRRLGCCF